MKQNECNIIGPCKEQENHLENNDYSLNLTEDFKCAYCESNLLEIIEELFPEHNITKSKGYLN